VTSTSSETNANGREQRLDRVKALLSEPLLLPDEDHAAYDDLLTAITAAVQPADIIEQLWTSEAVQKAWEALRQRRYKTGLIAARQLALAAVLHPLLSLFPETGDHEAQMLAWRYTLGHADAIKEVDALFDKAHLSMAAVEAQAMAMNIDKFEMIDRLIWVAEERRDALLALIERRRAAFGQKLRRALAENADVTRLGPPAAENNIAAAEKHQA
jgi:hypothetical protein